jgi:hypothetical protein
LRYGREDLFFDLIPRLPGEEKKSSILDSSGLVRRCSRRHQFVGVQPIGIGNRAAYVAGTPNHDRNRYE